MLISRLTKFMRIRDRRASSQDCRTALAGSRCARRDVTEGLRATHEPEIVEVRGVFVGMAAPHALGYRFVAADPSVLDMSESIWPSFDDLRSAVAQRRRAFLRKGRPLFL